MNRRAGIQSIAVNFPPTVRTNDYWRQRYPQLVANVEVSPLGKLWSSQSSASQSVFELAMQPYLIDPFRGARERRVLTDETIMKYEVTAARAALDAADVAASQVDLLISVSLWPDRVGFGNGLWLVEQLDLYCAGWNLETAQSGGLAALQTAAGLVASGLYDTILVVVSCAYTKAVDEADTLAWFLGDGAGAAVVTATHDSTGFLSASTIHTVESRDEFVTDTITLPDGQQRVRLRLGKMSGAALKSYTDHHVRTTCQQAAEKARVTLDSIDFFVFNTPTAWFADFATTLLGVDPTRTVDSFPYYGNIGPALTLTNLHLAATTNRIKPGDLVLISSIGSVSSAAASVIRWGDTRAAATGPADVFSQGEIG